MSDQTTMGREPHERLEASAPDNYSGDTCVLCGREATGIDARIDRPTCRVCASMDLPDGVSETPSEEIATDGAGESHAGPPGVEQSERGEWTAFEMAADRLEEGGENE